MATKVSAGGAIAIWDDEKIEWNSQAKAFADSLNSYHEENAPPTGADPFPAGTAVQLAKEQMKDLKVLEEDKPPKYDEKAVY